MSSTITVAQISDSHLKREPGTGDASPDEMLRRAVELVREAQPDVLLERIIDNLLPFCQFLNQKNSAARRLGFELEDDVGRAGL